MPAKSERQRKFMAMCANQPDKVKGDCPPKQVARDFSFRVIKRGPKRDRKGYY